MANGSNAFATVMTAVAVLAATTQSLIMWQGRNSHVELNLHLERVKACAGVAAKYGPLLSNVNALADQSAVVEKSDREEILAARAFVKKTHADINEHLSVLELISEAELRHKSASLALDIQNLLNNATDLKDLGDEKYRDLRAGIMEEFKAFTVECRSRLGVPSDREADSGVSR